ERIEALKPAIEACGISTLSQSPMLGFHKQMDNRIKLLEEILSFRMQGSHFFDLVIGKILTSRLSLSKHLAHNLGNLLLLGKIGVFHNRRNASSRLLLLISKHLILCIYLVFRILA